jgi:hypothetical protein
MNSAVDQARGLLEVLTDSNASADDLVGELDQLEAIEAVEALLDERGDVRRKLWQHQPRDHIRMGSVPPNAARVLR